MRTAGSIGNVVLIVVTVLGVTWLLWDPGQPVSQQAVDWISRYYDEFPIGGGWRVIKIEAEGRIIRVRVVLPDEQAEAIMAMPPGQRLRVMQVACPGGLERIWRLLDTRQDIEITAASILTPNDRFINASCRTRF